MSRGLSLWLDLLRVAATLVVVLSHLAYARFTGGDLQVLRDLNIGSDAVVVFFVISGLVIACAADRDGCLATYAFNRLTRLWSVLLPAILLTVAFDHVGRGIDPTAYPAGFYQDLLLGQMLLRGLSFSNEWAVADRVRLGSNGPLWSLSYEAAFYLIFGAATFLRGPRRLAVVALLALLAGPRILLLMPAWLMGVALWRYLKREPAVSPGQGAAIALAIGSPLAYVAAQTMGLPQLLSEITAAALAPRQPAAVLAFSEGFLWNALIGAFVSLHLVGMARLAPSPGQGRAIRWAAGASFSVYVTHYPALHLCQALLPEAIPARGMLLLGGSLAIGLAFAAIFERTLPTLRRRLRSMAPRADAVRAAG